MRRIELAVVAALLSLAPASAVAQHTHQQSPYAGQERRVIKALSPEQVAEYLSGEGMGLALAAELNHYPGPRHVLELSRALELSEAQARQIRSLEEGMRAEARRLGEAIVERERSLDQAFATGSIDEERLDRLTAEIARLQGELRRVHLSTHLAVTRVLTAEQVARYDVARGYTGPRR